MPDLADAFEAGARAMLDALHGDASHTTIENPHDPARGCPCGSCAPAPRAGGGIIPEHFAQGILGSLTTPSPIVQLIEQPQQTTDPCALGAHRWAWLTDGGQACGRCGTRR